MAENSIENRFSALILTDYLFIINIEQMRQIA